VQKFPSGRTGSEVTYTDADGVRRKILLQERQIRIAPAGSGHVAPASAQEDSRGLPGFEVPASLIGLIGAACLLRRK